MVACAEKIWAREARCHPALELGSARLGKGMWIDETDPRPNRELLV